MSIVTGAATVLLICVILLCVGTFVRSLTGRAAYAARLTEIRRLRQESLAAHHDHTA